VKISVSKVREKRNLKTVPQQKPSKLAKLKKRDCIVGDPESIVHMDWLNEWTELK
jgi:hypothetical protein